MPTTFTLNGKSTTLDADPDMPLLWAVREVAGLPGTKFGCGVAMCGACTVHLDGVAIRSCVMPLASVANRQVTTIEGLQGSPGEGGASGVDQAAGAAVRLLPIRPDHVGDGAALEEPGSHRCRYRRGDERQHLPLRDVFPDTRRDPRSRPNTAGMTMATRSSDFRRGRRAFLKKAGAASAAALTIGFEWAASSRRSLALAGGAPAQTPAFVPNAFLRVGTDGSVTVIAKHVEMGQGAYTGIATIVAEELDADWERVRVESAPADAKRYANLAFGTMQGTGGSSAMANSWLQLREAGAKARAVLVAAAAKQWHIAPAELVVDKGVVIHAATQRRATFASLVPAARSMAVPDKVVLKDPRDFKLIGQHVPRVDVPAKCDGSAQFTLDTAFPGMLVALLRRAPRFGATVQGFDGTAASAVPGVVKIVQVPRGIAVIANSFWAAKRGRDALVVSWDETRAEKRSSAELMEDYRRLAEQPARSARKQGDAAAALRGAARTISAGYEFPYLAHAPMEPLDAVVKLTADSCEIWAGDQFQTIDQSNAAQTCGLKPEQVIIHTLYAGGSFGRRANAWSDFIVEAVSIAKAHGADGTPIKLQWTREDDIGGGLYRPMFFHKLEAGLERARRARRLEARHRRPVHHDRHSVRGDDEGWHRPHLRRGRREYRLQDPEHCRRSVDHRGRRAGAVVAGGRLLAHHVCGRGLHRRGCPRGRPGSVRVETQAARGPTAHEAGAGTCGGEGRLERRLRCRRARAAASRWRKPSRPSSRRSRR